MKNSFHFFLFFGSLSLFSQEDYRYFGTIKLSDTSFISYSVRFSESKGKVKGYSITDMGGKHETRSNIYGEYDKKNNELNFRETDIVYTKSDVDTYDFCYVNTTIQKFKMGKTKRISAPFLGLFSDNTECISGELILVQEEKIEKKMEKLSRIIQKSRKIADSIKEKADPIKAIEHRKKNILENGETLNFFTSEDFVNLIVFDPGQADNDKVSISIDSKVLFKELTGTKQRKEIKIPVRNQITSIEIMALNEGRTGLNTVKVEISDKGSNPISSMTNLKSGEEATIRIHKKTQRIK